MASADLPKNIGWVGLGLMGLPMATNLLKKMDAETKFYVFDVMKESVETFVNRGEGRVEACGSSKEVADKSVCTHNCLMLNILTHEPCYSSNRKLTQVLSHRI